MTTEPRAPDRDLDDDDEEPIDSDIALVTNYLCRELSPEDALEFEERYIHDEAFAAKVEPVMMIWTAPIDFRAAYEAYAAKEAANAKDKAQPASPRPRRIGEAASEYTYAWPPAKRRRTAPPVRFVPDETPVHLPAREERGGRRFTFLERVEIMYKIAAIAFVAVMVPSATTYWYLRYEHRNAFVPVGADGRPVPGMERSQGVEVPAASRSLTLTNGSRVVVRGGTKFNATYAPLPGVPVRVNLDGEAAFDVSEQEQWVDVITSAGRVLLRPGTYAVRCEPGCAALLVTVGVGKAGLRGDAVKTEVLLLDGEHGMVRRGAAAEKVDASAAAGFPALEVTPRDRTRDSSETAGARARRSPGTPR